MDQQASQAKRVSTSGTSSNRASTAKRSSTNVPKAPTSLDPNAIIANHAVLTGIHTISVAAGTVIHPHARIISTYSAVDIGPGCIVSEKAVIGLSDLSQDDPEGDLELPEIIKIGQNVNIESGTIVEAAEIGENTLIDVDVKLGAGSVIGKNCTISACSVVPPGETVPDYTVIYGNNQRRLNKSLQSTPVILDIKSKGHEKQLNVLQRLVPSNLAKWQ
ncbi:transferase hexapeptide domain protein [Rhizodiscina lignyota]|uniref:Dynactin subunit 6 n=1 Tax=Rhizodiscina lignyota TaxID=1504668 RepID=A0A9P4MB63_9PEZI|nr:transferase hexapeptide domain protein [Rhizodiscina lignyota]